MRGALQRHPATIIAVVALISSMLGTATATQVLVKDSGRTRVVVRDSAQSAKKRKKGRRGPQGPPGSNATINGVAAGGDLTGSYPNPLIRAGAVDSTKVLDGSLLAADILSGQIATGASAGGTGPPAFASTFPITSVPITLERTGPLLVFGWADAGLSCAAACSDAYGLYVDGVAVPGSGATLLLTGAGTVREQLTLFGVTAAPVAAGAHTVQFAFVQSAGTNISSQGIDTKVAAVQLGP